ncbi:MAG: WGR domain-containing protein [Burkholderiales bacterium]
MFDVLVQDVDLRRIDPAANCFRFYRLALWPDLFGGASVVRHWGRIGTRGRQQLNPYPSPEAAARMLERLHRQKLRRGYVAR